MFSSNEHESAWAGSGFYATAFQNESEDLPDVETSYVEGRKTKDITVISEVLALREKNSKSEGVDQEGRRHTQRLFGAFIRRLREEDARLDRAQFAEQSGIYRDVVTMIELGHVHVDDLGRFMPKLASALGCYVEALEEVLIEAKKQCHKQLQK